jgi:hypothetical protein
MLRTLTRGMSGLWGYNGLQRFLAGDRKDVQQTVFHAPWAILCPKKGVFYCRSVLLNTANPQQDFVVWIKMVFAQEADSSRDRRQSIATATLPSIGQTRQRGANMPLCFACRRLLCCASRTSRDTPQSSVFWTFHPSRSIPRGALRRIIPWHHDRAADKKNLVC